MLSRSAGSSSTTKELPPLRLRELLDARNGVFESVAARWLRHERECAPRQPVLSVLVRCHELNRNVARGRVLLEAAENGPSEHVRQEHVERHGGRVVVVRQGERVEAARRDEHLEAVLVSGVDNEPGIVHVVLDNEQDEVADLDVVPIVGNALDRALCNEVRRRRDPRRPARAGAALPGRRIEIVRRNIERKRAPLAGCAPELYLAAEQSRELAADGEAEARAAVLAARSGIRLLEGFEDELLFLGRDAYSRIPDLECDNSLRGRRGSCCRSSSRMEPTRRRGRCCRSR